MKKPMTITLAVLLAAISAAPFSPLTGAETAGVQSLRTEDVAAPDRAPEEKVQLGDMPGAQKRIARTFQQQPPLIPHATANFDEITLQVNPCLLCHETNEPRIGVSHFKDSQGKMQKTVSRARYVCTQCHVPQVDAPPLVENTFQTAPVKATTGK